ncbi:glycosyltransferase family 4 protein [Oharaeibacter diazotrophicus]|uniref:Glycosyltransferase subfamily 4-like N-terminal domain-containing protein n=2 Tax=Oharaeibacter diazotrophicus TaxID=1920512 RepID=A0A4R6R8Q8_9HYPH|nr:glycosyltransferase family 4 protein [Oharaeibacter diazotrophicus]TDP82322.1 hypothetical protein EDD54_3589 [Oharaeibacter diazotrophicus]GLS76953.1 glycosyltransferase WbuB [Oharaeibacter diazotrophicus]
MRILFLTHYYAPEVNAPASRTAEHCRIWARAGHEVTVVTGTPNHPQGTPYPGYGNPIWRRETVDGVDVVRLWTFLAANEGFGRRTANYVSYAAAATAAAPFLPKADVVVSTSPQFFCGLAGWPMRLAKRARWVLEIRDLWPESIVAVGAMKASPAIRMLERLEAFAYRRADAVVAVANAFVPHIAERRGRAEGVEVFVNGVDLSAFSPGGDGAAAKRALGLEGRFVAAYVGTHGMAHGLDTLLDAADRLRHRPDIVFLLVGDGAERKALEAARAARGLDNVVMLGQRPKSDMPAIWSATDVSLIHLRRSDLFKKVLPSKMAEAMGMERPIVLGVEGEAETVLRAAGAGIAVPPEDADALAAAVVRLADDPAAAAAHGRAGRAYAEARLDRGRIALDYLDLLERVARL